LKQVLQCRLHCAIRDAESDANFLVAKTLEYTAEDLLLAFRQERADSLLLPLVNAIGHELDHLGVYPHLSTHNEPDGFGERARRIMFEEDARRPQVQRGRRLIGGHSGRDHQDLSCIAGSTGRGYEVTPVILTEIIIQENDIDRVAAHGIESFRNSPATAYDFQVWLQR
jgi:hypothetical protein